MSMVEAVNAHVLDHLVNGPATHRELMDAAQSSDAAIVALRQRVADLKYALRSRPSRQVVADLRAALEALMADESNECDCPPEENCPNEIARRALAATQPQEVQS